VIAATTRSKFRKLCVSFERTGGFAGICLSGTLDAETLPPRETVRLCRLLEAADFFNLPPQIVSRDPMPDRFQYKLSVTRAGRQHTIVVAEGKMPSSLRPLIKRLIAAARK